MTTLAKATPLQDARAKLEAMESHAKRLTLSLECLLLSCKDIAAVSKWWDSSHVALTEYQAAIDRLYPSESVGWVETCNCRFCGAAAAKARAERLTQAVTSMTAMQVTEKKQ